MKSVVKRNSFTGIAIKIIRAILIFTGAVSLILALLAFTSAPFRMWYNLSVKHATISRPPGYIIILGGGGMPSETGLMRTWYGAKAARYFARSKILVALPGDPSDSLSSLSLMKKELILRGIDPDRIILEESGANTKAQAVNINRLITNYELRITNKSSPPSPPLLQERGMGGEVPPILIVTSPEHLTRAVLTFKKAGFSRIDGLPAFENAIESDITFNDRKMGGREWIPGIGESLVIRYHFWTQLRYEEMILREYLAMAYYKLKGWI